MVSANDGHQEVAVAGSTRHYFLIRDRTDGAVAKVAERLVPLDQGSNFRDIGGYAGAGGSAEGLARIAAIAGGRGAPAAR